jgi:hypothetical protein
MTQEIPSNVISVSAAYMCLLVSPLHGVDIESNGAGTRRLVEQARRQALLLNLSLLSNYTILHDDTLLPGLTGSRNLQNQF